MLSEKAKGKQRAVEFHALSTVPAQAAPSEPPSLGLVIRFTEGIPDLTCNVLEKDSIRDVKTRVRLLLGLSFGQRPIARRIRSRVRARSCKTGGCALFMQVGF